MFSIQNFSNENFSLHLFRKDDEPWFIAKQVCQILSISKYRDAISFLDEDEKSICPVKLDGWSQSRSVTLISESGLYALILRSRKPQAKSFKRWLRKEVLPAIRKNGEYRIAHNREKFLAEAVVLAQQLLNEKEQQNLSLLPKADKYDAFIDCEGYLSNDQAASLFGMGRNLFIRRLRSLGIYNKVNLPTAKYRNRGFFSVRSTSKNGKLFQFTLISPYGFDYLTNLIDRPLAKLEVVDG